MKPGLLKNLLKVDNASPFRSATPSGHRYGVFQRYQLKVLILGLGFVVILFGVGLAWILASCPAFHALQGTPVSVSQSKKDNRIMYEFSAAGVYINDPGSQPKQRLDTIKGTLRDFIYTNYIIIRGDNTLSAIVSDKKLDDLVKDWNKSISNIQMMETIGNYYIDNRLEDLVKILNTNYSHIKMMGSVNDLFGDNAVEISIISHTINYLQNKLSTNTTMYGGRLFYVDKDFISKLNNNQLIVIDADILFEYSHALSKDNTNLNAYSFGCNRYINTKLTNIKLLANNKCADAKIRLEPTPIKLFIPTPTPPIKNQATFTIDTIHKYIDSMIKGQDINDRATALWNDEQRRREYEQNRIDQIEKKLHALINELNNKYTHIQSISSLGKYYNEENGQVMLDKTHKRISINDYRAEKLYDGKMSKVSLNAVLAPKSDEDIEAIEKIYGGDDIVIDADISYKVIPVDLRDQNNWEIYRYDGFSISTILSNVRLYANGKWIDVELQPIPSKKITPEQSHTPNPK